MISCEMISPINFYNEEIKGKELTEILNNLEKLRLSILDLEESLKQTNVESFISPSIETKLSCYRDYLHYSFVQLIKEEILKLETNTEFSFLPLFDKYGVLENQKPKIFFELSQEGLFKPAKDFEDLDIGLPYNFNTFIKI